MSSNQLTELSFETVKTNGQGKIDSRLSATAKYFIEALGKGVTLDVVVIPAGDFQMGSTHEITNSSEAGSNHHIHQPTAGNSSDETSKHEVKIPTFGLGKHPITQAQYEAVMGKNPSMFRGENRPVESVNWFDAVEFCQKLSSLTGKPYRLPSEAEWEYACKARAETSFFFGEAISTELANFQGEVAWKQGSKGNFRSQTNEVGTFPPNQFGLYGMHGNVFDWCEDTYHKNYQGAPADGSAWVSKAAEEMRVLRGGSWYHTPIACVATTRLKIQPTYRAPDIGFRVATSHL